MRVCSLWLFLLKLVSDDSGNTNIARRYCRVGWRCRVCFLLC
uniref:Uncharacterized protein n=1 Tax=Setaria viridis TaxID=4556 RepID=A0A4U6VKU6_SETVI|nr:hypothetical protein SEVIR_2G027351v2 [Setaria viridis]